MHTSKICYIILYEIDIIQMTLLQYGITVRRNVSEYVINVDNSKKNKQKYVSPVYHYSQSHGVRKTFDGQIIFG